MNAQDKFLEENQPKVESQKLRAAASGLFMGWADELEAGVRAAVFEDRPYEEIRDEIRSKVEAYQEANPGESLSFEALGAVAPTALMFLVPGGQAAGATNVSRIAGPAMKLLQRGSIEGGITGAGESKAESVLGVAGDAATGAATGAVVSPIVGKAGNVIVGGGSKVMNWMRQNLGGRPSDAAMAELKRLADSTGKSVDDIVQDIADGKILAENRSLAAAVRAIKSKGPEEAGTAPSVIEETLRARQKETTGAATEAAQSALFPGASTRNVFESIDAMDQSLKAAEKRGYRDVFRANPNVDDGTAQAFEKLAKRFPDLTKELDQFYKENNLVPLFKRNTDGSLEMVRIPSLEDSEIFYRLMRDEGAARWSAGKGKTAEPLTNAAASWKRMLDIKYPDLKQVRADAAQRLSGTEAFKQGRKAFSMDADALQFEFQAMSPEAQDQFRAGVLAAWKNKVRRSPAVQARGADVDRQEGAVLKIVLGDNFESILQKRLEIAGENAEAVNRILYGSMTAPQQAAEKAIGAGQISLAEVSEAISLNPIAIAGVVSKSLKSELPNLKPADYQKIADILVSTDPDVVRKVLNDTMAGGELADLAQRILATGAEGARRAATVTSSGATSQAVSPGVQSLIDMATGGMAP